jgi:hypothetical protein
MLSVILGGIKLLSKVVSPSVLRKLVDAKDNFQSCFRHFMLP